jgi:Ca-activated chloride channel homolog
MKIQFPYLSQILELLAAGLAVGAVILLSGCVKLTPQSTTTAVPVAAASLLGDAPAESAKADFRRFARIVPGRSSRALEIAPGTHEELWIIARGSDAIQQSADDQPGTGSLMAEINEQKVPMPLKHTDVRASVYGYIGSVEVIQQFHNPYSSKIEAVYVFPLPHNAAINEFIMTIGNRQIRGLIRERKEAEQIYQNAKSQGLVASLLTEERPNIFTQSVANIEPGKQIDVTIKYFHTLEYVDGWYEFVFPMVVGPRFNPPGTGTGVGAAPRGASGSSGHKTEVSYLKPGERSGHDISVRVDVNAGVSIEEFRCVTHDVSRESVSREHFTVEIKPKDSIPNRDFVLRYRVAAEKIKSDVLTFREEGEGYFTLMLYPPRELGTLARQPLELVFVLDCSGSMSGRPIDQARAAVERGLSLLQPGDSFQIIDFSTSASQLGPAPLEATSENIEQGRRYLRQLDGRGGTMMIEGIKAALDFPHDPERLRFVCFLTDGFIGNESEILSAIHQRLGASRIFSFGIGSSVNRYLIDHMAGTGRGAVAYLGNRDDAATIMEDFFKRISHPGLTDIAIDWGGMNVSEVYPREVPDLFVGRPVILTGRFRGGDETEIRISGNVGGRREAFVVPVEPEQSASAHPGVRNVWARMKIAGLAEQSIYEPDATLSERIRQTALDYGLMSMFTAFVAVDSARQTEGTEGTTVPVGVPVPEGVKYGTTVPEN